MAYRREGQLVLWQRCHITNCKNYCACLPPESTHPPAVKSCERDHSSVTYPGAPCQWQNKTGYHVILEKRGQDNTWKDLHIHKIEAAFWNLLNHGVHHLNKAALVKGLWHSLGQKCCVWLVPRCPEDKSASRISPPFSVLHVLPDEPSIPVTLSSRMTCIVRQ
jgi:hypothetical protein